MTSAIVGNPHGVMPCGSPGHADRKQTRSEWFLAEDERRAACSATLLSVRSP